MSPYIWNEVYVELCKNCNSPARAKALTDKIEELLGNTPVHDSTVMTMVKNDILSEEFFKHLKQYEEK